MPQNSMTTAIIIGSIIAVGCGLRILIGALFSVEALAASDITEEDLDRLELEDAIREYTAYARARDQVKVPAAVDK